MTQERQSQIDALTQAHTFPCTFMFKVIGSNDPGLLARAQHTVALIVGPGQKPEHSIRESGGAKHQSITLRVHVKSPEQVLDLYHHFAKIDGVKMVM